MKIVFVLLCILQINHLKCANILGIFPYPAKSHYSLGSALMKLLAEKGHKITAIVPYKETFTPIHGEYNQIILNEILDFYENNTQNMLELTEKGPIEILRLVNTMAITLPDLTYKNVEVQKLLKSNATFDVVIVESFTFDALHYFAYHFNASLILFSSLWSNLHLYMLIGNPIPFSYYPFSLVFSHQNFFDRLKNVLSTTAYILYLQLFYLPQQNEILHNHFPDAPNLDKISIDLALLNSHSSINPVLPHVPNLIDIGGFHVKPPKKLPENLQQFLDQAEDGVIYFSMGSIYKGSCLPEEKRQAFLGSFKKLKEKVLWKWENDTMPDKPANVEIHKWLPQRDILAHRNVKLFITHGGLLSITETIHHAVPVLVLPVVGDQPMNADYIEKNGYGVVLPYSEITEELFDKKLHEVLNNEKYRKNIKLGSALYHDRPEKPSDLAVYWIEYFAKHKNARHLKILGLDLYWYQNLLLDVIAFIILIFVICFYLIKLSCNCFRKKFRNLLKKKQE